MRLSIQVLLACASSAFFAGCYSHTDADPAQIGFDVVFPSTAAAVWSDGVKISVYPADSADLSSCLAAINLVTSGAQLPPRWRRAPPPRAACNKAARASA